MTRLLIVLGVVMALLMLFREFGPRGPQLAKVEEMELPVDEWFQENVVNNPRLVLLDFTADWCMYCRQQHEILTRLQPEIADQVQILSVDVDRHPDLAHYFQASALPTLVLLDRGKPLVRGEGLVSYDSLKSGIEKELKKLPSQKAPEGDAAPGGSAVPPQDTAPADEPAVAL
ncbi:thioredoxin family protein [Planctomicrobium sp. SH664]|uniref:thioredoxin family protein n=1 Tax=Planctomicrobium sp. SH664 TaxID=3448125 RepID=UPI003F5B2C24